MYVSLRLINKLSSGCKKMYTIINYLLKKTFLFPWNFLLCNNFNFHNFVWMLFGLKLGKKQLFAGMPYFCSYQKYMIQQFCLSGYNSVFFSTVYLYKKIGAFWCKSWKDVRFNDPIKMLPVLLLAMKLQDL